MPSGQSAAIAIPNDLESFWLPFTPNRAFKASPRLIARAKGMNYYTPEASLRSSARRSTTFEDANSFLSSARALARQAGANSTSRS